MCWSNGQLHRRETFHHQRQRYETTNTNIIPQVCIQFEKYLGIELTRVGEPDDPLEGSNITIICRTLFAEIKFPSPPEWAYQINGTGKMKKINEMNPPEG